jgi:ligand-binding sensor domain-containing protein
VSNKNQFHKFLSFLNFLILFFTSSFILLGQKVNIRFDHLGMDQGLSLSLVRCIHQDSQGFMWFGTQDGLNKYDGYKFTTYRHDPEDITSLSDNSIYSICEDSDGILWIATDGGLNKFDRAKEKFYRYQHQADNPHTLSSNKLLSLCEDSQSNLWIGTLGGGLNKFHKAEEKFYRYEYQANNPHSLSNNRVFSIYEDSQGILWIGTNGGGLNKFDKAEEKFYRYQHQADNPHSISSNYLWVVYEDSQGYLWAGTIGGGLNKFDRTEQKFYLYQHQESNPNSLSNNSILSIYEDSQGYLWIGTFGGGLNKFDSTEERFYRYQHQADNPYSLSDNHVWSVYKDSQGLLWIGTYRGLNKLDKNQNMFLRYQHQADNPYSLSNNNVWSIYEDSLGDLWIGTDGGLNKLDKDHEKFLQHQNQSNNRYSLSSNAIKSIFEDSQGYLWIGTLGGGLNKFVRNQEKFHRYQVQSNNPHSLSNNFVWSIYEDSHGVLWIGTNGGLNKFDKSQDKFLHYKHQQANPYSLSHDNIVSICEDSHGYLWVGTRVGLNKMDKEQEKFYRYQHQWDNPQSLSNNEVLSIYEDSKGQLWIGTRGGLNRFDEGGDTFLQYRERHGLPNDTIYGILEDIQGNLWLSTNRGISKFDPHEETFTNYDQMDGLQSNEFNTGAYFKNKDGRMYFGGINGFNEFHPNSIKSNTYVPPVVITDFLLFNRPVKVARQISEGDVPSKPEGFELSEHIAFTEEITLNYRDYIFAFEFSALNYRQSEKNQFAYMLEGYNEDWIHTNHRDRKATYTNLDPGKYIFRVKASNDDGYWNEKGASIKIKILPPFWKTWWFRLLSLLAFAAFSYFAIHFFIKYRYLFVFWKKTSHIGHYKLIEKIAIGGMGTVYKAQDLLDKTGIYALKLLREEFSRDETLKKRFKNEAIIIDQLDHPNIISIIDRGEQDGKMFMVTEYLTGITLHQLMEEKKHLNPLTVLDIMSQISSALIRIHSKNVIHRDLKPENIMLIEKGGNPHFVKILDFGISKSQTFTQLTQSGMLLGTLRYLSPEQVSFSEITVASDIFSLGIIFYEMLSGETPFSGETTMEVVKQILGYQPEKLNKIRPDVSKETEALILKMLAKDPQNRPTIIEVHETINSIKQKSGKI